MLKLKLFIAAAALLGLAACDTQPHMSRVTRDGKPCHAIGYSWSPVWVSPDGKDVCW
jgi:hypothetical protein